MLPTDDFRVKEVITCVLNVKRGIKMGGMDQAYEIEMGAKQTIDHRLARLASCPNNSNGNTFANHFDLEVLRPWSSRD